MDGGGGEPAVGELVGHLGCGALGAAEDDGQPAVLGLEHAGQHLDLVHGVRTVDELLDGLDRVRVLLVVAHGADVRRLAHVAPGQGHDGAGHGGGEEHRLAGGRGEREQLLDIGQEAQVEHLVGLVEDDDAGVAEVEVTLLREVDEPTGGADDDLDTALERFDLRLVGATAVDGEHADAALLAGALEVAGDLHGELAGRGHGERLGLAGRGHRGEGLVARGHDAVEHGDAEAEGLAGARLRLADDVVPGQRHGQGHRLDREGAGDVVLGERLDDLGVDREVGEGGGGRGLRLRSRGAGDVGQRGDLFRSAGAGAPTQGCGPIGGLRGAGRAGRAGLSPRQGTVFVPTGHRGQRPLYR